MVEGDKKRYAAASNGNAMTDLDTHHTDIPADARQAELRALQEAFRHHVATLNANSMSNVP